MWTSKCNKSLPNSEIYFPYFSGTVNSGTDFWNIFRLMPYAV